MWDVVNDAVKSERVTSFWNLVTLLGNGIPHLEMAIESLDHASHKVSYAGVRPSTAEATTNMTLIPYLWESAGVSDHERQNTVSCGTEKVGQVAISLRTYAGAVASDMIKRPEHQKRPKKNVGSSVTTGELQKKTLF